MSWLRDHVRNFVVPGMKILLDTERLGAKDVLASEVRPLNRAFRPMGCCHYAEAGCVAAAAASFGIIDKTLVSKSGGSWFDPERSKFNDITVRQLLSGSIDCEGFAPLTHPFPETPGHKWHDVMHAIVKNSWRSLQLVIEGKTLALLGRDVWPWAIMAARDGVKVVHDPVVSRLVIPDQYDRSLGNTEKMRLVRQMINSWGINTHSLVVFDTGFAGSIHRAMEAAVGHTLPNIMLSTRLTQKTNGVERPCQIFPAHKGSRAKALSIEYLPKYYKTGTVRDGQLVQYLAPLGEFLRAAALTIWWWHHQSPRFVPTVATLRGRRWQSSY